MNVLILGGDGYLGWPTAMDFAQRGWDVTVADNYLKRRIAEETDSEGLFPTFSLEDKTTVFEEITGLKIRVQECDLSVGQDMFGLVEESRPDTIIHYAEQPSAPFSMRGFKDAELTVRNNLQVTFNCIWAMIECAPQAHVVKLGTMGEYGTPNIDIEEGWIDIEHRGRKDKFLFPRAAGSLYHTTKVMDTDLLWFYVRTYGLRATDLMQGPVYGLSTPGTELDSKLNTCFHYDDMFGTVVNRFLVQAVCEIPLTVYGGGGQTRGYLNLLDTLQCVRLAAENPAGPGELNIYNQFTETFSVNEIAEKVSRVARSLNYKTDVQSIPNPRKEREEHYYNPRHSVLSELGLKPNLMTDDVIAKMLETVAKSKERIDHDKIMPRVSWS